MAGDVLLDEDWKPRVKNGDFLLGNSDAQEQQQLILSDIGWWKQNPTVGVGLIRRSYGPLRQGELELEIRIALEVDGFQVNSISLVDGELDVKAERL